MNLWHDHMVRRVTGREANLFTDIQDKLVCHQFCKDHGLPTPELYSVFDNPSDISFKELPDECVIKPTQLHSTHGVLVLKRQDSGFFDAMSSRNLCENEILDILNRAFEMGDWKQSGLSGEQKIIVEERIYDVAGNPVPVDYKVHSFNGHNDWIVVIDRNHSPNEVYWYDHGFRPINDTRLTYNHSRITQAQPRVPEQAGEMLALATRASNALESPFCRVDFYLTKRGPVVGEITLTPGGLYYGRSYSMSFEDQQRMGWLWEQAEDRLQRTSETSA